MGVADVVANVELVVVQLNPLCRLARRVDYREWPTLFVIDYGTADQPQRGLSTTLVCTAPPVL